MVFSTASMLEPFWWVKWWISEAPHGAIDRSKKNGRDASDRTAHRKRNLQKHQWWAILAMGQKEVSKTSSLRIFGRGNEQSGTKNHSTPRWSWLFDPAYLDRCFHLQPSPSFQRSGGSKKISHYGLRGYSKWPTIQTKAFKSKLTTEYWCTKLINKLSKTSKQTTHQKTSHSNKITTKQPTSHQNYPWTSLQSTPKASQNTQFTSSITHQQNSMTQTLNSNLKLTPW